MHPSATYLNGPRGPEYRRDDTAVGTPVRWYVYDGLGSVVGEVDPAGNMTASAKYDVYGAKRAGGTGTASSRQGFVGALGHVTDDETGLIYMRARYYDPGTGRFISEDPGRHGSNWYGYASNNPTNRFDFNGKDDIACEVYGAFIWNEGMALLKMGGGEVSQAAAAIMLTQVTSLAEQGLIPSPIVDAISKMAEAAEGCSMEHGVFMVVAALNFLLLGGIMAALGADDPMAPVAILAIGRILPGGGTLANPISKL